MFCVWLRCYSWHWPPQPLMRRSALVAGSVVALAAALVAALAALVVALRATRTLV